MTIAVDLGRKATKQSKVDSSRLDGISIVQAPIAHSQRPFLANLKLVVTAEERSTVSVNYLILCNKIEKIMAIIG